MGMPSTPTFRSYGANPEQAGKDEETKTEAPKARTNKYPGKCHLCTGWVEANQGTIAKIDGRWLVQHLHGCPVVANSDGPQQALFEQNTVNGQPLYDGIYTLELADHYRTLRLRTQALDDDFMPGSQIVQYLNGRDNEHDYTSFGHIKNGRLYIWKRFQGNGLEADAKAFFADPSKAEVSVNCYRCGRTLTVPASVHDGLGPECARKGM